MTDWFYIRHKEGAPARKVGPFESAAKARRFIAHNIADNGYGNIGDASKFARSLPAPGISEFKPGVIFEVIRE